MEDQPFTIKIAISTHLNFYQKTLKHIIPSLLETGIKESEINIFCGGAEEESMISFMNCDLYFVKYNSFDLTSLIAIVEKNLSTDYWFLIHDTCKVGAKFKKAIYNIPDSRPDKVALRNFPSMSIGLYKYTYLQSIKNFILLAKKFDSSHEEKMANKNWFIANEDYILWRLDPKPYVYGDDKYTVHYEAENIYETKTKRILEYYPSLDITKYKSNWGGVSRREVNL